LIGTIWRPLRVLDGFGDLRDASNLAGVTGANLIARIRGQLGDNATSPPPDSPQNRLQTTGGIDTAVSGTTVSGTGSHVSTARPLFPGMYQSGDRILALNVLHSESRLQPIDWPANTEFLGAQITQGRNLGGVLLGLAMLALAIDTLATLFLSGRLVRPAGVTHGMMWAASANLNPSALNPILGPLVGASVGLCVFGALPVVAQTASPNLDDGFWAQTIASADRLVLAHVVTGDAALDARTNAGLYGLSRTLSYRTSIEPGVPVSVDLEQDGIALFPLLYWPISVDQPLPSAEAYARLNAYLRSGGMIVFDTRDGDISGYGITTPEGRKLQSLAAGLDIPALDPVPTDHVLTRAFYLLQDFPGRFPRGTVWVEAALSDVEQIDGMPFRNLNDGVTPVVIGGADWAGAWAVDANGMPMVPVGHGFAGDRQRELALRFGVNLVMHVLSGNYKSDQVHVPALLERLGQ
jgi:hypothetical protein